MTLNEQQLALMKTLACCKNAQSERARPARFVFQYNTKSEKVTTSYIILSDSGLRSPAFNMACNVNVFILSARSTSSSQPLSFFLIHVL